MAVDTGELQHPASEHPAGDKIACPTGAASHSQPALRLLKNASQAKACATMSGFTSQVAVRFERQELFELAAER